MSDLRVDTAALELTATELGQVAETTQLAADSPGGMHTLAAATGHADLTRAGEHFLARWTYGLTHLAAEAHALETMLRTSVRGYSDVEAQLTAATAGPAPAR